MDNQFLSTPRGAPVHKINSARDTLQKDELIRGLEVKNNKLRGEIMKIQKAIDQNLRQEPEDRSKERQSIMKSDASFDVLTKQLDNAYKKIKLYEYEISKIEESQASLGAVQKVKQVEAIMKEKKAMQDRLRAKLVEEQRVIAENTKKLSNNNRQQEIQKQIKSLSDEIKFLREKQKEQDAKDEIRQSNMKKQIQFIRRVQSQLVEGGMSPTELEDIKTRVVNRMKASVTQSQVTRNDQKFKQEQGEAIEDRTIDNFRALQSQIRLLEKMQGDNEKKIFQAEFQKQRAVKMNCDSRDRLLEIQDEIQRLERQILIQKGKVLPSNMKPLRPLRSVSSHYVSKDDQKKQYAKNVTNLAKSSKALPHILKYDQVGLASEKGQRFTDRNVLGKKNLFSKIVSLSLFINNQTGAIAGVHALYSNKKGGEYVRKDRQTREQQYKQQKIVCNESEWIKSMTGTLNEQDRLESLYVITNKNQSKRFGEPKTTKKSFSFDIGPDEVPVCIFGSLLVFKQAGKPEYSIVEHFGIEINSESSTKADNSYDALDI